MQAKDKFLEKTNFFCLVFLTFISFEIFASEIKDELKKHSEELKNLSVNFIQSDGLSIEEGIIHIGGERLKVDYLVPNNISITMSEKKGMYVNHQLREVQFFNTKRSFVKIFLSLFLEKDYYENANIAIKENTVEATKVFIIDDKKHIINLLYEFKPLKLKKIKVHFDGGIFEIAFFNYQKNKEFTKNFFTLISPYL